MSLRTALTRATSRQTSISATRLSLFSSHLPSSRPYLGSIRTMASLPKTMKGIIIEKTGGTEVLQYKTDLPLPEIKGDQILVKNEYMGINFIDTYYRSGLYKAPHFPYVLGRDSEGTIVKAPANDKYGHKEGDRVVCLPTGSPELNSGTYAEYTALDGGGAYKIPDEMPPKVAVASLLQGLTALTLIRESYPVQKGDWVLVHAAAGGCGLWLCQLLKAVGAHMIGTASTEEKTALAKKYGAEVVINYSHEDVKAKVMEVTNGEGVKAVFDGVGKATFDLSLDCLARKGTLASYGNASGAPAPLTIARLSPKNAKVMRPTMFNYIVTRQEFEQYVGELFDFILKEKMDSRIYDVYPLKDAARAQHDIESRKTTGKLLLQP